MEKIGWEDFARVELRVGRVLRDRILPGARKCPTCSKSISARHRYPQIERANHRFVPAEEHVGKLIVGVVNFPGKQIGAAMSGCLVPGFHDENGEVVLCIPDRPVPLGGKLA